MQDKVIRLLLIEDDKVDQMAFARFVKSQNLPYDYTLAGSVAEAREVIKSISFDIIIADYMLSDGTSFELFDNFKDCPIIVTTGSGNEDVAVEAMKLGACDYLIKDPAGNYLKTLPATVELALKRKQTEAELKNYHEYLEAMVEERTVKLQEEIAELKQVEAQLLQAQKMESIGTLAGGIAHDFNNILTAIYGYSEIAMANLEEGSTVWHDVQEIHKAGERAANLTRQLLAFSRKQVIIPKALKVSNLINDMQKMLSRLISEDIRLTTELDESVGAIYADPGQFEQVILNLVVNARDAVKKLSPEVEKIIQVSTSRVLLDDDYVTTHLGSSSGWHLQLRVEDNGCGMAKEVLNHIFEPFYTTKDEGGGTGMGLSTVYGIVKQNYGSVNVYSEPGQGTTFKIYWPLMAGEVAEAKAHKLEPARGGGEVILLAEDSRPIREIAVRQLRKAGYTVIVAADGREALEKAEEYQGSIDLLFTDVVMPIMGGKELNEKIKALYPDITTLYSSGYIDNGVHQEILTLGKDHFINKPYNNQEVRLKIRHLLDENKS